MTRLVLALIAFCWSGLAAATDCVVLLHGLARTSTSMSKMERALAEEGYYTANIDYPSRYYTAIGASSSTV